MSESIVSGEGTRAEGAASSVRTHDQGLGSFLVDSRGILLGFDLKMEALTGWAAVEVVGRHKDLAGARDSSRGYEAVSLRPLYEGPISTAPQIGRASCRERVYVLV